MINSYDILDVHMNLTDRVSSLPILNLKGTMQRGLRGRGSQGTSPPFFRREGNGNQEGPPKSQERKNTKTHLRC